MKLIDKILYLEFKELVDCGISDDTILKAKSRGSSAWHFIQDPAKKSKVLIGYEGLQEKYKKLIAERFGNPYEYMAKAPIKNMLEIDFKAEQFFKEHRYDGDKYLSGEHVKKYTTAASWLNLLIKLNSDKKIIRKELGLTLEVFFKNVGEIIEADEIALPASYLKLRDKMHEYSANGYECLIHKNFGNKLAAKIGKTENGFDADLEKTMIAFIRKAASMHNNYDAMQITSAVNTIFEKQNWPTISHTTVYNVLKENKHLTLAGSRGKREWNNKYSMQVKRNPPKYPLYYLTLDGWTVELLFRDKNTFHNRLVVVVVLDAVNKYPLGFAIGERENAELIREANRNAAEHIFELFGEHYQPQQLQSDNYALKANTPFYQAMAHLHTPAAVGNAKAKIIEPYFKYLNKNYCQRLPNWSGFNIDAKKENQPNREWLDMIKHSFPDKDGVITQIKMIINQERNVKGNEYKERWQLMPESEKLIFKKEDRLMVFGKPTGFTNTITGMGLMPTITGQKMVYDSFNPSFRELHHLKWQVIFDERDLSQVLAISEDNKHRFVLDQKRALPMDVHSMDAADHQYLTQIRNANKAMGEKLINTYITDNALVEEVMSNTSLNLNDFEEAALKLMFTSRGQQKEQIQDAKRLNHVADVQAREDIKDQQQMQQSWEDQQRNYLQSKTNFNQYLD
jgi:hypothetical protein